MTTSGSPRGARCAAAYALTCAIFGAFAGCSEDGAAADAGAAADTGAAATNDAGPPPPDAAAADASVVPCPEPTLDAPTDVFCIGLYEGRDPTRYSSGVMAYTPGVTLWSDGAEKQRYLYLPPSTQIDTSDMDVWKFPVGTKAFKEFRFDGKLVETRMFWKRGEHDWAAVTYVWDASQTSAPLNTQRTPLILATGYEIPAGKDCGRCHHGGADKLLGVEAIALALPTAQGETLARLVADGLLSDPPAQTSIELPEDATGKAAAALGYLHANCGMPCHSSRGLGDETNLLLRLRADEFWLSADEDAGSAGFPAEVTSTDAYVASINKEPTTASVAQKFPGAYRITPGAHDSSLLWLLSHRRGMYQMPPLVSHIIDETGTQKIADWIDALPH